MKVNQGCLFCYIQTTKEWNVVYDLHTNKTLGAGWILRPPLFLTMPLIPETWSFVGVRAKLRYYKLIRQLRDNFKKISPCLYTKITPKQSFFTLMLYITTFHSTAIEAQSLCFSTKTFPIH